MALASAARNRVVSICAAEINVSSIMAGNEPSSMALDAPSPNTD
ncbi:MAG: hypothetical protein WC670_03675 [Pseudolabrys sp.]|jgi:hypothetical protein